MNWTCGPRSDIAPCCEKATNILVPARYDVEEFPNEKAHGLMLRRESVPWGPRRFGACIYARPLGYLPQNWAWEAPSLYVTAPPLSENLKESAHAETRPAPTPSTDNVPSAGTSQMDKGEMGQSQVVMPLNKEIAPPAYDLSGRCRKPCRTEDPAPQPAPTSSDMSPKGHKKGTANNPYQQNPGIAPHPRVGHRVPSLEASEGAQGHSPSSWSQQWSTRWK